MTSTYFYVYQPNSDGHVTFAVTAPPSLSRNFILRNLVASISTLSDAELHPSCLLTSDPIEMREVVDDDQVPLFFWDSKSSSFQTAKNFSLI